MAPEVVNYDKIGYGTDMWSVGVICYVLLSGLSPFMGDNDGETYNNIIKAEVDFDDESFSGLSDEAKDFIRNLLIKDIRMRMNSIQALNHPWLNKQHIKLASTTIDNTNLTLPDDKIINTKNLKRFVIRRRWQVCVFFLSLHYFYIFYHFFFNFKESC